MGRNALSDHAAGQYQIRPYAKRIVSSLPGSIDSSRILIIRRHARIVKRQSHFMDVKFIE
jgi:hypothetical protein